MSDQQTRFIFEKADIRGELVQLDQAYSKVLGNNPLPTNLQGLLGEFLSAVSLLSATLKFNGILTLQARGSGPLSMIMAECSNQQQVRAIAKVREGVDESSVTGENLQELIGKDGVLAIIIDPDEGERYQGIVPLDAPKLAQCIEHYFEQSEQIQTRIWLASSKTQTAGLLLQALPKSQVTTDEENREVWHTAQHLVSTVRDSELLELTPDVLVHRLLNEFQIRLFDSGPISFHCDCSRQRSGQALVALGYDEVLALLSEQSVIEIDCQFCHEHYQFSDQDLEELFPDKHHTVH